jgi:DNA-binding MarR family transcriptional regulator
MQPLDLDADVPPSARHVAHVLQETDEPLTMNEIAELAGMPQPTVKHAIRYLRDADAIESRPQLADTRAKVYERV